MKTKLFICMVFATLVMQAQTIYVSSSGDNTDGSSWAKAYSSIQAALAAATSGNEIWVQQGTYVIALEEEQLNFVEGVNVYGGFAGTESALGERSSDANLTTISHDATGAGGFRLLTSVDLNTPATWDGFTFDGSNVGTGVYANGNCSLNNVVVKNCTVTDGGGAGVYIGASTELAPASVTNSVIKDNTIIAGGTEPALSGGAGIYSGASSDATLIENCTISGNTLSCDSATASNDNRFYGAGIFIVQGVIRNSTINDNHVTGSKAGNVRTGGGIGIRPMADTKTVLIDGCSVTDNSSPSRGGAIIIDPSYGGEYGGNYVITNSNFINNSAGGVGGAILCTTANATVGWELDIINSIFANNSANTGGALHMNTAGTLKIIYSTIVNNSASATYGGGGVAVNGGKTMGAGSRVTNSIFWGNTQGGTTPARTQLSSGQIPSITNCAIQDYDAASSYWANATMADIIDLDADNLGVKFLAPTASAGNGAPDVNPKRWQITDGSVCLEAGIDEKYSDDSDILTDFAGKDRPLSSDSFIYPDLGAYQYDASNPPTLSIENILVEAKQNLKLYPTITTGVLNIKANEQIKNIEIYNVNGSTVLKAKATESIDVSSLSNGLYLLRATFNDNITAVKRFVKK